MTKAISTTTTAVPATTPGLPHPSRRSFIAVIGSSLLAGGSLIIGAVQHAKDASTPTLLLPSSTPIQPRERRPAPMFYPLLSTHPSEAHAIAHIKAMIPQELFHAMLEGGLRQARTFRGRDSATMECVIEAAVEKHGGIIAAMRAGAL